MDEMRELYKKITRSPILQKKLVWIANEAAAAGHKKTRERLVDLARDAGFDVTIEEMKSFFVNLAEEQKARLAEAELAKARLAEAGLTEAEPAEAELTEEELDMVAGGKAAENALIGLFSEYL